MTFKSWYQILFFSFLVSCSLNVKRADSFFVEEVSEINIDSSPEPDGKIVPDSKDLDIKDTFDVLDLVDTDLKDVKDSSDSAVDIDEKDEEDTINLCKNSSIVSTFDYDGDGKGDLCDSCPFFGQNIDECPNFNSVDFLKGKWFVFVFIKEDSSVFTYQQELVLKQIGPKIYKFETGEETKVVDFGNKKIKFDFYYTDPATQPPKSAIFFGNLTAPGDKIFFNRIDDKGKMEPGFAIFLRMAWDEDIEKGFYDKNLPLSSDALYLLTGFIYLKPATATYTGTGRGGGNNPPTSSETMAFSLLNFARLENGKIKLLDLKGNETQGLSLFGDKKTTYIFLKENFIPFENKIDTYSNPFTQLYLYVEDSSIDTVFLKSKGLYGKGLFSYFGDFGVFTFEDLLQVKKQQDPTQYNLNAVFLLMRVGDATQNFLLDNFISFKSFGMFDLASQNIKVVSGDFNIDQNVSHLVSHNPEDQFYCSNTIDSLLTYFFPSMNVTLKDPCMKSFFYEGSSEEPSPSGIILFPGEVEAGENVWSDFGYVFYSKAIGFTTADEFNVTSGIGFAFPVVNLNEVLDPDCDGFPNSLLQCSTTGSPSELPFKCSCSDLVSGGKDDCPCNFNFEKPCVN